MSKGANVLHSHGVVEFIFTSTGLRPIYVVFFEFLPISFQMKNNDDMRL